jgi:DNA-binding MarR family transcriptional regulator
MPPAVMTAALDRLEGRGYVRRVRDTADRRRILVEVTEEIRQAACAPARNSRTATAPGSPSSHDRHNFPEIVASPR